MTQVILFNGPPRCGKDYAAAVLKKAGGSKVYVTKFAKILKEACHAAYGIRIKGEPVPHDWFEDRKDEPCGEFFGATPRSVYISFSENHIKPLHGQSTFGDMLLRSLLLDRDALRARYIVISDSGFERESRPIVERYGWRNVRVVRLFREGTSFEGDSRGYWFPCDSRVQIDNLHNDGVGFAQAVRDLIGLEEPHPRDFNLPQKEYTDEATT